MRVSTDAAGVTLCEEHEDDGPTQAPATAAATTMTAGCGCPTTLARGACTRAARRTRQRCGCATRHGWRKAA